MVGGLSCNLTSVLWNGSHFQYYRNLHITLFYCTWYKCNFAPDVHIRDFVRKNSQPKVVEKEMLATRITAKGMMKGGAGRNARVLEFSAVVLVYDRLCGTGVCWLAELASCEF